MTKLNDVKGFHPFHLASALALPFPPLDTLLISRRISLSYVTTNVLLVQLLSKIVHADFLPVDRTLYSERLSNLVDHLLIPDPNTRPKIDMVSWQRFRFFMLVSKE